ncbi:putative WD repeat-containing protein [Venturia inaequalis]|nr:putative WD repeat-containing protein [Venturia inaequalis]
MKYNYFEEGSPNDSQSQAPGTKRQLQSPGKPGTQISKAQSQLFSTAEVSP